MEAADSPGQAIWATIWTSTGPSNTAGSVTVPNTELISGHLEQYLRMKVTV